MTKGPANNNWVAIFLAAFLLVAVMASMAHAQSLTLPQDGSEPIILSLPDGGLATTDPSGLLQVFVGQPDACCEGRTPMAGRYKQNVDALTFLPAFGFETGQDYFARIRTALDDRFVPFRIPVASMTGPAAVTEIYPSADTLPENTLRFYIHFAVPMQPSVAFDYIKLRDASGAADMAAFMRFKQELWNADRTRLTVLIDPGRIKRNVATNVALGPALLAGMSYSLTIDAGWPSADGASVLPAFAKPFRVAGPLRARPDTGFWTANAPCSGTREPLTITFDRPFDRHLLARTLRIKDGHSPDIQGDVQIGDAERSWSFTPKLPWVADNLQVVVKSELEDVAGNNFRDALDHNANMQDNVLSSTVLPITLSRCDG